MEPFRDDDAALSARALELEHELEGLRQAIVRERTLSQGRMSVEALSELLEAEKHALALARLELSRVRLNPRGVEHATRSRVTLIAFIVLGFVVDLLLIEQCRP